MAIPELVRQAALFPELDLPDPPPEHPYEVVHGKGYSVGIFPDLSFGQVSVSAIAEDVIERTIEDARSVLATYGMSQGAWMVPEAASPAGLATDLRRLGMVSYEEPPLEPRFARSWRSRPQSPVVPTSTHVSRGSSRSSRPATDLPEPRSTRVTTTDAPMRRKSGDCGTDPRATRVHNGRLGRLPSRPILKARAARASPSELKDARLDLHAMLS